MLICRAGMEIFMIENLPYFFSTDNGIYFYDNSTNIILPITKEEKEFLSKLRLHTSITDYKIDKDNEYIIHFIKKYGLFQKRSEVTNGEITSEFVHNYIRENGISHMCLIVTDQCNFRCKYCIYSDHYFYSKNYTDTNMSLDVALKAIDYYFKVNQTAIQYNPQLIPSIGFYGGEPLLNWEVIVASVEHAKKYDANTYFSITTNGYLLDQNKIQFMLDNNFSISISLDGDKESNDRNRVNCNNQGTFDVVYKNILLLQEAVDKRPDKKIKNAMVNILITQDNLTDLEKIYDFFHDNPNILDHITNVNSVNNSNTDYYDCQCSSEILSRRNEQVKKLLKLYKENLYDKFLRSFFSDIVSVVDLVTPFSNNGLLGCCIPGAHKLTVATDGNYHACEKINQNYPIGNVESGLNFDVITKCLNTILELRRKHCNGCNLLNLCGLCLAHFETDSNLKFNENHCRDIKEAMNTTLKICYSIKEAKDEKRAKEVKENELYQS